MTIDLQTTISVVTGIINLVLLGALINFFKTYREIAKEKEELIKEQKNLSDSKTQIVEKELAYTDRQRKQLEIEKEHLQKKLTDILKTEGIGKNFILEPDILQNLTSDFIDKVDLLTTKLELIASENEELKPIDGNYHLSLGNGYIISKDWEKAAYHLEYASKAFPTDPNIHFTRGVCYSNMRGGIDTDRKCIDAYSKAITYISNSDKETRNKAYIYRGAMLKRIGKLDEAENDIKFGISQTKNKYFLADGTYNLACIYAMKGNKEQLYDTIKLLKTKYNNSHMATIKYHLNDYFKDFKNDDPFNTLINQ